MAKRRAYVTLLSTDDYLDGLLVLNASLRKSGTEFGLLALLSQAVSVECENVLKAFGITTKRLASEVAIPDDILLANARAGLGYWNNVFDKLCVFDLIAFDTIVYLDSDMLILRNIDDLFDRPHLSAVAAGRHFPGNESWVQLNAGLMVIEPQANLSKSILASLPDAMATGDLVSDQTLLHHYCKDWPSTTALHLDDRYNMFADMLDYHADHLGYRLTGPKAIAVVHFIGAIKPWHRTLSQQWDHLRVLFDKREYRRLVVTLRYLLILTRMRMKKVWISRNSQLGNRRQA